MGDLYNFCPIAGAGCGETPRGRRGSYATGRSSGSSRFGSRRAPGGPRRRALKSSRTGAPDVTTIVRLVQRQRPRRVRDDDRQPGARPPFARRVPGRRGPMAGPRRGPVRGGAAPARAARAANATGPSRPTRPITRSARSRSGRSRCSPGLPEYEARAPANELCLTLLRCVGVISQPERTRSRPGRWRAGPALPRQRDSASGATSSSTRCCSAPANSTPRRCCARPRTTGTVPQLDTAVRFEPPLKLEGDVVFSCLKGAQDGDGLILRCFNPCGRGGPPASAAPWRSRTRLDETGAQALADGAVTIGPGGIATLRLRTSGPTRVTSAT